MLEGKAVVDPGSKSLVRDGAREVLAVVAHHQDLPLATVELNAAEKARGLALLFFNLLQVLRDLVALCTLDPMNQHWVFPFELLVSLVDEGLKLLDV